ncbi:DegT/DnrJ/EryC1/StrS family aminotransferase [Candidatus Pacearchaeota archaeon]|nr:DegT/DnrJ/EryC1/StrS family aminotransferase [Candidatus Pacearchaeota archaeon]
MEKELSWKEWENPGDPHLINRVQWDKRELESMMLPFYQDWHGYGKAQQKLENELSKFTGISSFNLTNSGSTAITTGLKVLKEQGRFKPGDLILHPVTTFPTSISPAIDYGGIPVFIDTKPGTYVVDEDQVERAIKTHPEIKGMVLPYLLGNIPNMDRIKNALGERWLIEDSCDTMGGYFGETHVGNFGDFAAFSFYGSHHMTTAGVGGAVGTNDKELTNLAKSIIFWGHDYETHDGGKTNTEFLKRYATKTMGNDFQMTGVQAGFGLAQIEKIPGFIEARNNQFKELDQFFKEKGEKYFILPRSDPKSKPSWFSYPLVVKEDSPFTREEIVEYLTENNVEIRPIMCGNILKQPPFSKIEKITLDNEKFPVADAIEERGFFIPAWGMSENQRKDYNQILEKFLEKYD